MFTQSHVLSKYIDAKRNRRRKAVERQKRLKVGLPAAVPLKHVSLDPEQREAIASTEAIGTARRKRLFVTRHFGWPISLGIHVFVAFLLTIYAVTEYIPEGVPVFLDFVEPIREPRDIRRRSPIKPANPPKSLQIQPKPTPQAAPRVIELPREVARFVTPEDNLSDVGAGPTAGGISIPEGLGNIQVEQGRAEIPTELGVKIDRDSSIAPEDSEIDISEDGLGDRAIDADVSVQVDQQPRVLRKTKPKYPEAARRAQKEGFVELEFTVGVDGKTTDIKVVKEEPKGFGFGRAAIESVKRWRFTPAKKGGENVPMRVKIPIRFTLEDD